jgi:hypothetical protein
MARALTWGATFPPPPRMMRSCAASPGSASPPCARPPSWASCNRRRVGGRHPRQLRRWQDRYLRSPAVRELPAKHHSPHGLHPRAVRTACPRGNHHAEAGQPDRPPGARHPLEIQRTFDTLLDTFSVEYASILVAEIDQTVETGEEDARTLFNADPDRFHLARTARDLLCRLPHRRTSGRGGGDFRRRHPRLLRTEHRRLHHTEQTEDGEVPPGRRRPRRRCAKKSWPPCAATPRSPGPTRRHGTGLPGHPRPRWPHARFRRGSRPRPGKPCRSWDPSPGSTCPWRMPARRWPPSRSNWN